MTSAATVMVQQLLDDQRLSQHAKLVGIGLAVMPPGLSAVDAGARSGISPDDARRALVELQLLGYPW